MSWSTRARVALAAVVALAAGSATPAGAQELTLSVAISMKEAIETVGRSFTASRPGLTLRYNLGASGDLQKQIEAGAPIDVFVSAATRQMDELEQKGLILPDTRRAFARNVLVVVKPADSALDLTAVGDLLDAPRHARRHRQPEDGAGGAVRPGEPACGRRLGAPRSEAGLRGERPPGPRVRRARRGRRGLRLRHRRGGRRPAGPHRVPAGGGHLSARSSTRWPWWPARARSPWPGPSWSS